MYGKLKAIEIYRDWAADHLLLPYIKLLKETKRGLELVSLSHFPDNFWRKIFVLLYFITWPNFIVWSPLLCEILSNMCIAIVCKRVCDVMNFEVNLIFHRRDKNRNILRTKRVFKMKLKAFFIIFKGLSIKLITKFFGRWESAYWKSGTQDPKVERGIQDPGVRP